MDKIDIKDLARTELERRLADIGAERYRAGQIWRWLFKSGATSFDDMIDLPAGLKETLKSHFHITKPILLDLKLSRVDGTTKYLVKLEDKSTIEIVSIPEKERNTICLSSQVGCRFKCAFCASAPFGFIRNLKSSEILDEVLFVRFSRKGLPITNLVFMGIGEPLDNYDNIMKAIRVLNDKDAFGIGARRITISTCGIIPGIKKLEAERLQVELSVSLHSADDRLRTKLVPVNKRYRLKDLIETCREYTEKTGRIVTFEYVLLKDVNSSSEDALKLAGLLKDLKCKVNTIAFNRIAGEGYEPPERKEIRAFVAALKERGVNVTHRKSRGEDIDAGCGQLRITRL